MKPRITYKKNIMNLLVLLWILLEVKWFYLPSNTHSILVRYNYDGKNFAIVVVSCLIFLSQLILYRTKKRYFIFKNQIMILWGIWIVAYIFAVVVYQQNPFYTFNQFIYFGIYILYFAALWYFEYADGYKFFSTLIALCTGIFSTLIVVQAYVLQSGGPMFLTILEYLDRAIITRYGLIRVMSPSVLLSFSAVISFARLFQNRKNGFLLGIIDAFNVVAGTIYVFYACGTRFLMLILLVAYGLVVICKKQRNHLLRTVVLYFVVICALYYALTQDIFYRLSFDTSENGFTARIGAIAYYIKQGLKNPLCGLGFLTDQAPAYASLLHGTSGTYYISDVGIFGFVGQMGIIAACAYMLMVVKIWKLNYKIKKLSGRYNTIVLVIVCYTTLTLPTLSLQTNATIVGMVLSLIFVEHEYEIEIQKTIGKGN